MALFHDPERDPRLGDALRARDREIQARASAASDDALRARIVRAAWARGMERRERPWWLWTAGWARIAVPIGVAASLAAAVILIRDGRMSDSSDLFQQTESGVMLSAASLTNGGTPLTDELVATASDEWLFGEAMAQ